MSQPEHLSTELEHAEEGFNAGEVIIRHVANSGFDHPIIHLPPIFGIDFSVTKHVFMLWFRGDHRVPGRHRDDSTVSTPGPNGALVHESGVRFRKGRPD